MGQALVGEPGELPDRDALQTLAATFSTDLATLYLIGLLTDEPEEIQLHQTFRGHVDRVRTLLHDGPDRLQTCLAGLDLPPVWFVPGWFYQSQPGTGAAFARQRRLFDRLGVRHRLVPTGDAGTVEDNAAIVAAELARLAPGERVILVSASKGGPEAAHALGTLLPPSKAGVVTAWVNVGGLLQGSPVADFAERWPISWLAPLYFWDRGLEPGASVASLTTARSRERFRRQAIPPEILVVNFVGIPLSGDISPGAEFGYWLTSAAGPNDGLTTIIDELGHGGRTIIQVGLDHYYRDPEIDLKTLALAITVTTERGRSLPTACRPHARPLADDR